MKKKKDGWQNRTMDPDLMFEYEGIQFWVDCIYRSGFQRGSLELYYEWEYLEREKAYAELTDPLFIAVGVSGPPEAPTTFLFDFYATFNLHRMTRDRCGRVTTKFRGDFIEHRVRTTFVRKKFL